MTDKEKKKEYDKARYSANKDKLLLQAKAYRESHRVEIVTLRKKNKIKYGKSQVAYNKANKDKLLVFRKIWVKKNKENIKVSQKAYREANKEKLATYKKDYAKINKDKIKIAKQDYYKANKKRIKNKKKIYYIANINKIKNVAKIYQQENKDKINSRKRLYCKSRRKTDPKFRLRSNISTSIGNSLKSDKGGKSWEALVGYTLSNLKKHLEKQFTDGMTWENYGKNGWEIDHKIPVSVFNFTKPEHQDFKKCWALLNLQPMWAQENLAKRNKLDKHFQPSLLI